MNKYKVGDRIFVIGKGPGRIKYVKEFSILDMNIDGSSEQKYTIEFDDSTLENLDGETIIEESSLMLFDDLLMEPIYEPYEDHYLGEMATVTTDKSVGIRINVHPDSGRSGNPYFKVFDSIKLKEGVTKVARCHFFNTGMEYHKDGYLDWVITNKDVKRIRKILESRNSRGYSNWKMACWLWNLEYTPLELSDDDIDKYMNGKFDNQFKLFPSYVPSTTKIPETWIYDPPKGKNKRRK